MVLDSRALETIGSSRSVTRLPSATNSVPSLSLFFFLATVSLTRGGVFLRMFNASPCVTPTKQLSLTCNSWSPVLSRLQLAAGELGWISLM